MLNLPKLVTSFILAIAIAVMQVGIVTAQDATTTPLTGTVQTIKVETDATTSVTTVVVTYKNDGGVIQTVRLSVETAALLGLVTVDSTATPPVVANDLAVGQSITIDPATVITDTTEAEHPVGSKLTDFFGELLGVDYDTIMAAHENGAGFGVIAQALWMTNKLNGDATTFQMILEAKKTGDYSSLILPDGSASTATNWGQFKQDLKDKGDKNNLGSVMSGKANDGHGNQDKDNKHDKGKDKEDKGGKDKVKDKGKDKDKGKGKP